MEQHELEERELDQQESPPAESSTAPEDRGRPRRGCWRTFVVLFATLGILAVLGVFAAGIGWLELQKRMAPAAEESRPVVVDIPRGASALEIGRRLEEAGVIRSARIFKYWAAYKRIGPRLKAGEHVLDPSLPLPQVARAMVEGRFKLYKLTVPEGLTMKEISLIVEGSGLADGGEFLRLCRDPGFIESLGLDLDSLEGYLFPETYHFQRGPSAEEVARTMVQRFLHIWKKYEARAAEMDLTRHEIVTLASIIEKETGAAFERPLIASVFLNRLEKGMRLETDPTVIYGVEDFDGNLTRKHLETPTPYNTYIIAGLPPGPIASPGEDSIRAVFEPADADYIFFVSKNDGSHQFSETLREHNRAVNKYQRRKSN